MLAALECQEGKKEEGRRRQPKRGGRRVFGSEDDMSTPRWEATKPGCITASSTQSVPFHPPPPPPQKCGRAVTEKKKTEEVCTARI